jgi:hypothetical protein
LYAQADLFAGSKALQPDNKKDKRNKCRQRDTRAARGVSGRKGLALLPLPSIRGEEKDGRIMIDCGFRVKAAANPRKV